MIRLKKYRVILWKPTRVYEAYEDAHYLFYYNGKWDKNKPWKVHRHYATQLLFIETGITSRLNIQLYLSSFNIVSNKAPQLFL